MKNIIYYLICLIAIIIGLFIVWLIGCEFIEVLERISIDYILTVERVNLF